MQINRVYLLLIFGLFCQAAQVFAANQYGPQSFTDKNQWTAIVAAFAPEIKAINQAFEQMPDAHITQSVKIKGVTYQLGTYKGEPIVIFTTGISVVNAAMTMQMAIDYFPIDKVVMMGIAGAINPAFRPGDISVPERWYFHDESIYANPAPGKKGEFIVPDGHTKRLQENQLRAKQDPHFPRYESFEFILPREVKVIKQGWNKPKKMPYFSATAELIALARKAVKTMPPILMPSGQPIRVEIGGNGVTGSVFLDNAKYRQWLQKVYQAQVAEMESAAVAQVCFINDIDWIVIRSVSDLAGGQKGVNQESVFEGIASGTGTKLLIGFLDELVKQAPTL